MATIGFIGAGTMAEAILQGLISARLYDPRDIHISDIRTERCQDLAARYGVVTAAGNAQLTGSVEVLVLSVKPKQLMDVLKGIKGRIRKDALVISIVAGKTTGDIASHLGDMAIIRVMPNTPALINQGASALYANAKAAKKTELARQIFACVGKVLTVDEEDQMHAVTAVSGSGPAYYFLMMESMINAATTLGLSLDTAKALVLQTAKGAALLAEQADMKGETPADLTRKVATPGGTTEAALTTFKNGQFDSLVTAALTRACQRSCELSGI